MSDKFTPEELAKLPKWAQQKARLLNFEVARLETENQNLSERNFGRNTEDVQVFANPYDERPVPFAWHTTFEFGLGRVPNRSSIRVRLFKDMDGKNKINVNSNDSLIVMPTATNDVLVTTDALMKGLSK